MRCCVAHGKLADDGVDVAVLHEQVAHLAMERLVATRLRSTQEREGRILVRQNTIHRIHHVNEPHMRISSVATLVGRAGPSKGRIAILTLGVAIAAVHAAAFPAASSAAYPPSAEGRKVAVATDHSDATRAALEVMASGGNAADGAVAAALV